MSIYLATLSNTNTLKELCQLLQILDDKTYERQNRSLTGEEISSIGVHCRHILEFYQCFFLGLSTGIIDYDSRLRDINVEHCKETALDQLFRTCKNLAELPDCFLPETLTLKAQVDCELAAITSQTCALRELIFLQNHSVHHLALIAALLNSYGLSTPSGFGLANSTHAYRISTKMTV